jgi:hypothetical protein
VRSRICSCLRGLPSHAPPTMSSPSESSLSSSMAPWLLNACRRFTSLRVRQVTGTHLLRIDAQAHEPQQLRRRPGGGGNSALSYSVGPQRFNRASSYKHQVAVLATPEERQTALRVVEHDDTRRNPRRPVRPHRDEVRLGVPPQVVS